MPDTQAVDYAKNCSDESFKKICNHTATPSVNILWQRSSASAPNGELLTVLPGTKQPLRMIVRLDFGAAQKSPMQVTMLDPVRNMILARVKLSPAFRPNVLSAKTNIAHHSRRLLTLRHLVPVIECSQTQSLSY